MKWTLVYFETTVLLPIIHAQPASLEFAGSDLDSLNWDVTTIPSQNFVFEGEKIECLNLPVRRKKRGNYYNWFLMLNLLLLP